MQSRRALLRIGVGAVAGYAAMVVVVIGGTVITWLILGPTGAFQEGSTVASTPWSLISCIFGLFAALLGGVVAVASGPPDTRAPELSLACLVFVLGLLSVGREPGPLPEGKATADLTFFEAGSLASSPAWYNVSIIAIGVGGVLLGARQFRQFRASRNRLPASAR